ncbi:DNA polymerase III subunit alpha, partial [Rhodovulum sulfidophilum]|nr:DNA polymerase III subunit alpha [Rhodovulum sulfidophilum]
LQMSDPTGLFEVTLFSDVLEVARDHLEPGMNVVVQVEANLENDQLKLLGRSVQPVDTVVADAGAIGLKVVVETEAAVEAVATLLDRARGESGARGRGPIEFSLVAPDLPGEVRMTLNDRYPVNPQIKGALRSLPGVAMVEEV